MRVLVAADALAGLGPRDASEVIATAFMESGAEAVVIPLASGGQGFADAVTEVDPEGLLARPATLAEFLEAVAGEDFTHACAGTNVRIDLTEIAPPAWHDLTKVGSQRIEELASALAGKNLVAVVRFSEQSTPLTGLSGRVAERGREDGADLGVTLAANDAVSGWLDSLNIDGSMPGTGAADGIGSIVVALGGRVLSGIQTLVQEFDMETTVSKADLLVTGTSILDFHAVGGDVVKEVARMGTAALLPVIVVAGRSFVSSRELRLAGIESAHAILDGAGDQEPTSAELARVAGRVAISWSW